ncbi:hypothetical protein [Microbacterium sp. MM2322]|uniref:hypothetical protein n=1 Tax=Microbacterium sp. MM2322 TaxID=3157631 RepID=UPI0032D58A1B
MSALHTIIAAARQHSRTTPARPPLLPAGTRFEERDIRIGGRSLRELAQTRTTPCVLIAPAERSDRERFVSVVVTTVTGREEPGPSCRTVHLSVDSDLDDVADQVTLALLLGGATDRSLVSSVVVGSGSSHRKVSALLPAITSPGDRIVLFCEGTVARSQLVAPAVDSESDEDWTGRCGK